MKRLSRSGNHKANSPELDTTQSLSPKNSLENLQDPKNGIQKKKKNHKFNEVEIRSLIEAVKARPLLWTTSPQFDSEKKEAWQEIYEELNFETVELSELKKKWNSLRYAFKQYTEKLAGETVGHGASLLQEVSWVYFKQLLFLYDADDQEGAEVHSSAEEISYIKLEPEIEILGGSPSVIKPNIQVSQQADCQFISATPSSAICPSPATAGYNQLSQFQPRQDSGLLCSSTSTPTRSSLEFPESNTSYCNQLLAELRLLPPVRSRHLRRLLIKKVHDYIDSQI